MLEHSQVACWMEGGQCLQDQVSKDLILRPKGHLFLKSLDLRLLSVFYFAINGFVQSLAGFPLLSPHVNLFQGRASNTIACPSELGTMTDT